MAVTSTFTRTFVTSDNATTQEFVTATFTGTYITGGFTWNPFAVSAKGDSPAPGRTLLSAQFISPLGYTYVTTISGNTATTKIFSAANTEFTTATNAPDATVNVILTKKKI